MTEYSSHPATPPPPEARTLNSEKPRVIIIAVRRSGRVRMHKSKENPNGSFSIGKTWNLDDLSHIESFTGLGVNPQHREWAGDTGFLVTLGKPYFWQAQSDKEKKFFIASMIKIYGKYTSGKTPELTGFDQKELDQVLGAGKRPPGVPPMRPPPPNQSISSQNSTMTSMSSNSTVLHNEGAARSTRTPPVRYTPSAAASPAGSFDSTTSRDKDRLNLRKVAQNNKSQDSVGGTSFMTGRSEDASSIPPRSRNGLPSGPGPYGRFGDAPEPPTQPLPTPPTGQTPSYGRSASRTREEPGTPQGRASSRTREEQVPMALRPGSRARDDPPPPSLRPGSRARDEQQPAFGRPPSRTREDQIPPERRRPPMDPTRPLDRDLVPPPLMGGGNKRDPVAPPPRSADRLSPRKESVSRPPMPMASAALVIDFDAPTAPEPPKPEPAIVESPGVLTPVTAKTDVAPTPFVPEPQPEPKVEEAPALKEETETAPPVPPEPQTEPEEERPGLGPMIKSKKSKGEIAGAFWKAASAVSAFKPRPGGAGDRLRQAAQKTSDGPDGITGVVPAPPRPVSRERETTPEPPPKAPQRASNVPEVKISVPNTSRPASTQEVIPEVILKPVDVTKEAAPKEPPRRSVAAGNDSKFLQSLGIDPSIVDSKGVEFGGWLDYFGWVPGAQMRKTNMDDMKVDLERELNKAQAGGWLARFREGDERVEAIKTGIDQAMAECEELDNLLTLYSVELSVCLHSQNDFICANTSDRHYQKILLSLKPKGRVCRSRLPIKSY